MPLEKMNEFFDARVEDYEAHMFEFVDGADQYYQETALALPRVRGGHLLDLGCGTGLELDEIYPLMPDLRVTGIDLSDGMLKRLKEKHADKPIALLHGSYFDLPLGHEVFDMAVSVESLHHFERAKKTLLYAKILRALKPGGVYVETDYVAPDAEYEAFYFAESARLRAEQGIADDAFYHYDTPHTIAHLTEMLLDAGFAMVETVWQVQNTAILRARKA